jgi:hypothetical protein
MPGIVWILGNTMNNDTISVGKPKSMAAGRGAGWLFDGFDYFRKNPLNWVLAMILLIIISIILNLVPVIGGVVSYILLTVFVGGMMLGCHSQKQGGEFKVNHLFAGFTRNTGQLVLLGVLYLIGNILILMLLIGFVLIAPGEGSELITILQSRDPQAIQGVLSIVGLVIVILVGLALYVPLLMAYWFAPSLVVLGNVPAIKAMQLSFMGCLVNVIPFLVYGVVALVLLIIAAIPFALGLLILMPMVMASIYIAFREIFIQSQ